MKPPVVGFAGMTHLGLVSAASVAGRGFDVVCFDADAAVIRRLAQQDWPVLEPGLDELIRSNAGRQRFTDAKADLRGCDEVDCYGITRRSRLVPPEAVSRRVTGPQSERRK